jgi:hypothetical protein
MTGACHNAQFLLIEMGSYEASSWLALKLDPMTFVSQVGRITGVSHQAWLALFLLV